MNILKRFKLSKDKRKHNHLVVSDQIHDAVKYIAETRRLTISESAEYLIRLGFLRLYKDDAK